MHIQSVCCGWTVWYDKDRKSVSLSYHVNRLLHPRQWFLWTNNGAVKGKDSCFDFNVEILGLHFSYTNWSYNRKEYQQ